MTTRKRQAKSALGTVAAALEAEAKARGDANAKPNPDPVEALQRRVAELEQELANACALIEDFGKRASILGASAMQAVRRSPG